MKATAGGFRKRLAGFGGMMAVFVLAGLTIAGVVLAPNLVLKVKARNSDGEEKTLTRIRDSFVQSIELTQIILSIGKLNYVVAASRHGVRIKMATRPETPRQHHQ